MSYIELLSQTILPFSLHGVNPRTMMGNTEWNKIKKDMQAKADHHCMICGQYVSHKPGDWLECHEIYDVDSTKKEFRLSGFICICKKCHDYIHQGRLRMLLSEERITRDYYDLVINRGNNMLKKHGLEKQDLPPGELKDSRWYLLYNDNKYSNI